MRAGKLVAPSRVPDREGEIVLRSVARKLALVIGIAIPLASSAGAQAVVLHDQTDNVGPYAITSEVFDTPPSIDDTLVADDFSVPLGQSWTIDQIDVLGQDDPYLGMSPPHIVNFFMYSNAGTLPGSEIYRFYGLGAPNYPNDSVHFYDVPRPPPLGPGSYWVSVQEDGGGFMVPSWGWSTRTVQDGQTAAFEGPNGGWGSNCRAWQPITVCPSSSNTYPDMAWKISGAANSLPVTFGNLKRLGNGTARLTVNAPASGTLTLGGKGVKGSSAQVSAHRADTSLTFRIRATGKPLKRLNATGRATVKPILTFTSGGATPSKTFRKVKLVKH